jgi:hypothetical protein
MASVDTMVAPVLAATSIQSGLVDVGDGQDRAGGVQLLGQIGADVADALDGDGDALQVAVQGALDAEADAAEHALGGDRRRIARGGRVAFQAGDEAGASCGCFPGPTARRRRPRRSSSGRSGCRRRGRRLRTVRASSGCGCRPMITALPPPRSRSAMAFLYDMPRDRRSASS